ncbi:FAD-dependent oxidoreductase [Aromatoleum aromaticum]|nr:FAD-dependent oxidoreductase [Aromatoleum aromaticum]
MSVVYSCRNGKNSWRNGMETIDCAIIGAGVVGLACARALAAAGREVVVIEREATFGTGVSSRNSEVIHAGLYYAPGSLKARLCVEGREMLYAFCQERAIPHARCGKLIVAARAGQADALRQIRTRAEANGVGDLRELDRAAVAALEPALDVHAALLSPSTGIVDSHALMLALLGDAERDGAMFAFGSPVLGGYSDSIGMVLQVGGERESDLRARWVINASGLDAVALGHRLSGPTAEDLPRAWFARGVYFALSGKAPFSRLIYPIPEPGGLGVHLTLDLGGQAKFGPDVEWIDTPAYDVDPARAQRFYAAIRKWWPALEDGRLVPGYAGVRPKIAGPGMPDADFRIDGPSPHGVRGLIHLFGIESPGLTAAMAIGRHVAREIAGR